MNIEKNRIGIIGGSGFYEFLNKTEEMRVKTPFGFPSDKITIGKFNGKEIVFLPRHGRKHQYPPHKIPYLANIWALKELGVEMIVAPCSVGSLKPKIKPGDFVICDQFVNFTRQRIDTFFGGKIKISSSSFNGGDKFGKVTHISSADPYCPELRAIAEKISKELKIRFHKKGTVVVIEGPRFSSRAESGFFSSIGDIINMTVYPELILARELEMCYVNIALVTDYDVGLEKNKSVKSVSAKEVARIFGENNEKVKKLIFKIIEEMPEDRNCFCKNALENAFLN